MKNVIAPPPRPLAAWRTLPARSSLARGRRFALACLALLLITVSGGRPARAEEPAAGAWTAAERHPQFEVRASSGPVVVDGRLDDEAWQGATRIPLVYETTPGENTPARVATTLLLTYDTHNLYAAFQAADPEPAAIVAHLSDRDTIFHDDIVGIILDPFNDERRAFEFFVNPLGVQSDIFFDGVTDNENESWDAIWDSAGRITETGFEVEMAIPFSSLRFPASQGEQTWGLDAVRWQPRDLARRTASQPRDRNIACHLCQLSKVTGFAGISPGRNLEIAPTVTANRTDRRESFPAGPLASGSVDSEAGLSLRWGITPNVNLNVAVNPDFSQVEADSAQLGVNEQFALFFAEKRPFFLEGADFFASDLDAVFTRNVADPSWGVKLTGKAGKNAFGLFAAEDQVTNLLLPGSESSSSASLDIGSKDAVLRYRRDLGERSSLGFLATHRDGGDFSSSLAGVDAVFRPTGADRIGLQWLSSRTRYPEAVSREFDQPDEPLDDWAGRLAYDHMGRDWRAYASYTSLGRDFRADMGFLPQVDYRRSVLGLRRIWNGDDGDWYTRISFGGDWDQTKTQAGKLLERETESFLEINGPRDSYLFLNLGQRDRAADGRLFTETYYATYFEIRATPDLSLSFEGRGGDQIDFANTRLGEIVRLKPGLRYNLGLHLQARLDHEYQRLDVDGGTLFTANLSQLRLVYQFNLRAYVRALCQYTRIERDPDLYTFAVDDRFERLLTQFLFSYKLNPQTVFFLGYADTSFADAKVDLTRTDRTFFLKIGYAWVL